MKFKVTGSNRDTGARMTLEFEAESRAAAERKAIQQGMNVSHIQVMNFGDEQAEELPLRSTQRSQDVPRAGIGAKLIAILIFLIVATGIVYFFWPKISALLGR